MTDILTKINNLLGIKESYKAPDRLMEILYMDKPERDKYFMDFLNAFDKDVTYDWFHDYFQDEHADRKNQKQDFTPQSVSRLLSEIVGPEGNTYYEPAAGTGGILIERWNQDRMKHSPFDYEPRDYYYTAEELSDRAIPFLLFNMLIRGMNGNVVQCDVLTREATGAFFIQNDANDFMSFSSLNLLPYNEDTETELNIKFVDEKYKPIKQTEKIPEWLLADIEIAELLS
ncbi:N-6 DNA methylase [Staphylococcus saprophyticus]|uniref:N-6 DNA methylase n=1 Tax=Staphylococcus saprophyticus TaxID=29385 RepID=UPI00118B904E|nr:N-6 DNA methylase [Staphylococcus saprophyticus]MDW3928283.1 N-6 DNA methylase [Staphylococcus saprophyticus]MDW4097918.1 N-6 DNA methylase [Staphylococcus saprophyticus]QDX05483.1 SAM-dependent DNA methyltransferase [Staphylococcus saprophyticus]